MPEISVRDEHTKRKSNASLCLISPSPSTDRIELEGPFCPDPFSSLHINFSLDVNSHVLKPLGNGMGLEMEKRKWKMEVEMGCWNRYKVQLRVESPSQEYRPEYICD